jgi:hypothetical protein
MTISTTYGGFVLRIQWCVDVEYVSMYIVQWPQCNNLKNMYVILKMAIQADTCCSKKTAKVCESERRSPTRPVLYFLHCISITKHRKLREK